MAISSNFILEIEILFYFEILFQNILEITILRKIIREYNNKKLCNRTTEIK